MPTDDADRFTETVILQLRQLAAVCGYAITPIGQSRAVAEDSEITGAAKRLMTAKAWLRAAAIKQKTLGPKLDGDPVWNILLNVYIDQTEGRRISITSACTAAGVPATTGLRWVAMLEEEGWLTRTPDQRDRRRAFLTLPADAVVRIDQALDTVIESDRRFGLERILFSR